MRVFIGLILAALLCVISVSVSAQEQSESEKRESINAYFRAEFVDGEPAEKAAGAMKYVEEIFRNDIMKYLDNSNALRLPFFIKTAYGAGRFEEAAGMLKDDACKSGNEEMYEEYDIDGDGKNEVRFGNNILYLSGDKIKLYYSDNEDSSARITALVEKPLKGALISEYIRDGLYWYDIKFIYIKEGEIKEILISKDTVGGYAEDIDKDGAEEIICSIPGVSSPPIAREIFNYPVMYTLNAEEKTAVKVSEKFQEFYIRWYKNVLKTKKKEYGSGESVRYGEMFMDDLDKKLKAESAWHEALWEKKLKKLRKSYR